MLPFESQYKNIAIVIEKTYEVKTKLNYKVYENHQ